MGLPAAVQRQVDRAAELVKGPQAPAAAPTTGTQPADDSSELAKANAELDSLRKQLQMERVEEGRARRLSDEVKVLQAKITELEAPPAEVNSLSEDDDRLLGDLKEPVAKTARDAVQPLVQQLRDEIKDLRDKSDQAYGATLNLLMPDWWDQNNDPKFIDWLKKTDPATQRPRDAILQAADAAKQAHVVAEVFIAFRENREISLRSTPSQPKPQNFDHGSGSGNPPPSEPEESGEVTRAFIEKFFKDKVRHRYRGREKEAAAIEAKINAALAAGLVR